jgi:hypothetical protein
VHNDSRPLANVNEIWLLGSSGVISDRSPSRALIFAMIGFTGMGTALPAKLSSQLSPEYEPSLYI